LATSNSNQANKTENLYPPNNLKSSDVSSTGFWLRWSINSESKFYLIYLNGEFKRKTEQDSTDFNNLSPGQTYKIQIKSQKDTKESDFSETLVVKTAPDSPLISVVNKSIQLCSKTNKPLYNYEETLFLQIENRTITLPITNFGSCINYGPFTPGIITVQGWVTNNFGSSSISNYTAIIPE
jgi:hypothetical protein